MSPDDVGVAAPAIAEMSDHDLVLRSRSGDGGAFGELWRRHYRSGIVAARSVSAIDPDDLVQEAYTRIFQAIKRGGGPTGAFRAYLFTSIRNTAAGWGRANRETPIDELDSVEDPAASAHVTDEALDRSLTANAFRSLPTRWQEVLWYTEIEQLKPADAAPLLGMSANAVAQLAVRAREGLREAWIQAHLRSVAEDSECRYTIDKLGAYSRGSLRTRAKRRVDEHLAACARCTIVASEAREVSGRLALVLLPLVIGVGGATGYLASSQAGAAAAVTVAAMPSSVIPGAVVAGGTGAAGSIAGSTTASGSSSGSAATAASGLSLAKVVGGGVVVAGAVAAAAIALAAALAGQDVPAPAKAAPAPAEAPASSPAVTHLPPPPTIAPAAPRVARPAQPALPKRVPAAARKAEPKAEPAPKGTDAPAVVPKPSTPVASAMRLIEVHVTRLHGNTVSITARVRTTPGATLTASVRGFVRGTAVAGADGIATLAVRPKVSDVVHDSTVHLVAPGAQDLEIAIGDLLRRG